ncbi:D-sedoheptulose 7-phosphate isomerase [Desulfothermus okinawensis JCM 13304]
MFQRELEIINFHATEGARLRTSFFEENARLIIDIAGTIAASLVKGGKVLICGNGGSASDAQHMAAEFVGRFKIERPPLPAIALTTDSSILTCISNDYSFRDVFSRQVKGLGVEGDVLVVISTSGRSKNILNAIDAAKEKNIQTIGLTGAKGIRFVDRCDYALVVPSDYTPIIQEIHISAIHLICELVDVFLFEEVHKIDIYS